jgi:non-ribosomal peptide synthetase component F
MPLDRPPLLRATLLELGAEDSVLAVALHHAVFDGWCFRLLDLEFSELYRAALAQREPRLLPLPLQFGEYAMRQSEHRDSVLRGALPYWREVLDGSPAESSLPSDRTRPPVLSPLGGQVEFVLDPTVTTGVQHFARERRTTPFVVLLAALTALTARLSGRNDLVIGTPVSARFEHELEPLIGCLTDVLPLRQRISPEMSFDDLVESTKQSVWGAVDHRDVPFGELITDLGVERDLSRFPLFQIVFTLDDAEAPGLRLPGIDAERRYVHNGTVKYDIFLSLVPEGGGLRGLLEYSADLYDATSVERLVDRYRAVLTHAVTHPAVALCDLRVMSDRERDLVGKTWTGSADPGPPPLITDVFAAQARRTPRSPAAVFGDEQLTYAELAEASTRLASYLVRHGRSGQRVAIQLPRSLELLVAVLGVLKAGSSYVPLDPSYPAERIAFMLQDSGATLLITDDAPDRPAMVPTEGVAVLRLSDLPSEPGSAPAQCPGVRTDDLAYVIYTSGSTGWPKGVAMPHGPLANLIDWQRRHSGCGPESRTLQFAPLSFDVSFQELFATWAVGGAVVLVEEAARRDPEQLMDLIDRHGVERLFLPYVALQQLARYACATRRTCPSLREVVSAGEQLFVTPAIRSFFAELTQASLENQYGPSETHVVTAERLQGPASAWPERPSI